MPWSQWVETMGLEPTTPCLQIVRTIKLRGSELGDEGAEAALSDLDRPRRVARPWHGPSTALRAWSMTNVRTTVDGNNVVFTLPGPCRASRNRGGRAMDARSHLSRTPRPASDRVVEVAL
jgi:hypothetical protein